MCAKFPWLKQLLFPAQVILYDHLVAAQNRQVEEPQAIKELTESNECDCKEFRKWLIPCEHMLEAFIYGDAVEPDWDKYSSLFLDQKFDVYEGKRARGQEGRDGHRRRGRFPGRSEYGEDAGK